MLAHCPSAIQLPMALQNRPGSHTPNGASSEHGSGLQTPLSQTYPAEHRPTGCAASQGTSAVGKQRPSTQLEPEGHNPAGRVELQVFSSVIVLQTPNTHTASPGQTPWGCSAEQELLESIATQLPFKQPWGGSQSHQAVPSRTQTPWEHNCPAGQSPLANAGEHGPGEATQCWAWQIC